MNGSAFGNFVNTKIFVPVPTEGTTIDPGTGNVLSGSTTLEVFAMLLQVSKGDKQPRNIPEDHINDLFLAGYLVEPSQLPCKVRLPLDCEAEIDGMRGRIWIPLIVNSPFCVDEVLGQRIQGYWRIQS